MTFCHQDSGYKFNLYFALDIPLLTRHSYPETAFEFGDSIFSYHGQMDYKSAKEYCSQISATLPDATTSHGLAQLVELGQYLRSEF